MAASLSVAFKNRILDDITGKASGTIWLATSTNSTIKVYTGAAPGIANAATGTLLGTIPLYVSPTSLMAGSNQGVAPLIAPVPYTPGATGTIGYARWQDSNSTAVIEGSVGVTASGADFIFDTLSVTSGIASSLTACSVKMPESLGTVKINSTLRDAIVDRIVRNIGTMPQMGVNGTVNIYTGSAPSSPEASPTGTLLASIPTGALAYQSASGGVANLVSAIAANAVATGTAGYARWVIGSYVMQLSVGTAATDIILSSTSLTSGSPATITDMSLSL